MPRAAHRPSAAAWRDERRVDSDPPRRERVLAERAAAILELFLAGEELYSVEVHLRLPRFRVAAAASVLRRLEVAGALTSEMCRGLGTSGLGRRYYRATERAPEVLAELRAEARGEGPCG